MILERETGFEPATSSLGSWSSEKRQRAVYRRLFDGRIDILEYWCGREDLNLHTLTGTCTSSMRVCQFRHDRQTNSLLTLV